MRRIDGVVTALATPFRNGGVDTDAVKKMLIRQIEAGVDWVLLAGTTGEGTSLTLQEKRHLLETALSVCEGRCGVMVGVSAISTEEAVKQVEALVSVGAQAILSVVPPYVKPPKDGLVRHFMRVARAANGVPVVLYNVPGRTGLDVSASVLGEVAGCASNIVAVKEASPDVMKVTQIKTAAPQLAILSGNDSTAFPAICLGAVGVVSVASNLVPKDVVALVEAARAGRVTEARQHHERLMPLFNALFIETNPVPLKAALRLLHLATDDLRSPLSKPCPETVHTIQNTLFELGLL